MNHRSRVIRRWRVSLSIVLTLVLVGSYLVGDVLDCLPGPLTWKAERSDTIPTAQKVLSPAGFMGNVGSGGPLEEGRIQDALKEFISTPGLGDEYSLVVHRLNGEKVADISAQVARQPASTLKTLTAAAAASVLDMSSQLDTDVVVTKVQGDHADLVLRGHGDMLLGAGQDDSAHVNGRAGLATLAGLTAQSLGRSGLTGVTVSYDDRLFGQEREPKGIAENNPHGIYFQAPASMAVDQGRDWTGATPGNDPDAGGVFLPRVSQPAQNAAQIFAHALSDQGIRVENLDQVQAWNPTDRSHDNTVGHSPIASVHSARLSEIMTLMLRTSDNTLAELFGRLTAAKLGKENSPRGAVQAVMETLKKLDIKTKDLVMADCSGLAPGSLATVETLANIQDLSLGSQGLVPLSRGLSLVGLTGTAADRNVNDFSKGLIHAKTGTLDQVTAMTGSVLRRSGGAMVFAVIINNPDDMTAAKQSVDRLIDALVYV